MFGSFQTYQLPDPLVFKALAMAPGACNGGAFALGRSPKGGAKKGPDVKKGPHFAPPPPKMVHLSQKIIL